MFCRSYYVANAGLLSLSLSLGACAPKAKKDPNMEASAVETVNGVISSASQQDADSSPEFRSIDGTGNNLANPDFGSAGALQLRVSKPSYSDGLGIMPEATSARVISNAISHQTIDPSLGNVKRASDYLWAWGQFIDHDLVLTEADSGEFAPISVPNGDVFFDPDSQGDAVISFERSTAVIGKSGVRNFPNTITAFLDGSMVYGSSEAQAQSLRQLDGSGKLRTSADNMLPFANGNGSQSFAAGDVRANENVALTSLHTLFVREHNHWVNHFKSVLPEANGDTLYQKAREIVIAEIQHITFHEYLPVLLGADKITAYSGYDAQINPGIDLIFSTAAYRHGHSLLSPTILRLDETNQSIDAGNLSLKDAFFAPQRLLNEGGISPVLRGLAKQQAQALDHMIVSDVRNFLFGNPGMGGLDLASLNIQRGRDHGIANYNESRKALGLPKANDFSDITSDVTLQDQLAAIYGTVDQVDTWIGGLAEDSKSASLLGELFSAVVWDQFNRLRSGDRFWFENSLSSEDIQMIREQSLATIIQRNTDIASEIQENVFIVPENPVCDEDRPDQNQGEGCY